MKKEKFVAYYRVSTDRQGRSGLGLEAQKSSVESKIKSVSGSLIAEFQEIESGKKNNRIELEKAVCLARETGSTLVVAKLDRLARDVEFTYKIVNSGVKFLALDIPGMNEVTMGVVAVIAQNERKLISSRTKAALAAKKARGEKLGNPQNLGSPREAAKKSVKARKDKAIMAEYNLNAVAIIKDSLDLSLAKIAERLNSYGARTAKGKKFTACTVSKIIKLYGIERPGKSDKAGKEK